MGKSQKRLEAVAKMFIEELSAQFPAVEQSVTYEDRGGYVVWVWVDVPDELMSSYRDIRKVASEIYDRLIEETGINIIAAVTHKNPQPVPVRSK